MKKKLASDRVLTENAFAKINLCLHVTGQRADGMHLLDSIVVFPNYGDVLSAEPADELTLSITGNFRGDLNVGADNLVLRAADYLGVQGAKLYLEKNLPVASGIGGGSADCAAAIRALCRMYDLEIPDASELSALGADVPVCLAGIAQRMTGVGEILTEIPALPPFWMVLVNTGIGVETGAVFKSMTRRDNTEICNIPSVFTGTDSLFSYLGALRNDMQAAAIEICPDIADNLDAIRQTNNCALARMSGSGGTCFGLFAHENDARAAALSIQNTHKNWWVVAVSV